ncbi:thiamine-phosphate kinase [Wenzhouxiangella sp. EGI_FJ10409]|uniref:thiamine-phosphate kinase n=1 Tax=Wenzhouxiangella sp. EGI_FJ10409 TaxID=3243767 RepID=UPI0035D7B198
MGEFELIDRIRARARPGNGVVTGIGDDAAVLSPTPGHELVVTTDSLVLERHFTAGWPAADIGHLAAQANLSDLAAMAARPRWALLALTLPEPDETWLDGFLDGFLDAVGAHAVALVGGNLARGPLNIGVELIGEVPAGEAVTRRGAFPGDRIVVTGTPGDAAAALRLGEAAGSGLLERLRRPQARVEAGEALRGRARAMIDLSDGLVADLGHMLGAGQGAELDLDALPASAALTEAVPDPVERQRLQAGGGSDYELLAVLAPEADLGALTRAAGVALTEIGRVTDSERIILRPSGIELPAQGAAGWDHFRDD